MDPDSEKTVLYLRGVPRKLVREAKAEAARQGRTVASLTCSALASALSGEQAVTPTGLDADRRWYERNRKQLMARYEGQYLAIVRGVVVDHDTDFETLAERVFDKLGPRPLFMPLVSRTPMLPRMRSPRVVRE